MKIKDKIYELEMYLVLIDDDGSLPERVRTIANDLLVIIKEQQKQIDHLNQYAKME